MQRDCTALFESYHLRPEVAIAHLKRLPVLSVSAYVQPGMA
jgi:hypothetical protein